MPAGKVELKKIGGRFRTVEAGTTRLARNRKLTPVDGGGWSVRDEATGTRQVQHINDAWERKRGRIS